MLDVPDRRPVEDVFCTDACYRSLFEYAGFTLLKVHCPLATGQESTPWVSEITTAAWTIYALGFNDLNHLEKSAGESHHLRARPEA
jgi:hypothetical protein